MTDREYNYESPINQIFKNFQNSIIRETENAYLATIHAITGLDVNKKALEQEPKTGHWEYVQYDYNPRFGNWHCSECRTIIPHMPEETDNTPIYKWCPMCGADMREGES